jgi:hypothetical protein
MFFGAQHFFYALPTTLLFWSIAYAATLRRKKVPARWSRILLHLLTVNLVMTFFGFISKLPNPDGSPPQDFGGSLLLICLVLAFISCTVLRALELRHIRKLQRN